MDRGEHRQMIEARTLRDTVELTPAGRTKLEGELHALRAEQLPWFVARLAELHEDAIVPGKDLFLPTLLDEYALSVVRRSLSGCCPRRWNWPRATATSAPLARW